MPWRVTWSSRTTEYAMPNNTASSPNASGTDRATTATAAIAARIPGRSDRISSGEMASVTHVYTTCAHHSAASQPAPREVRGEEAADLREREHEHRIEKQL